MTDKNRIPQLIANLQSVGKKTVKIGVFNPEVATYAAANEFGVSAKGLPERSFIRKTIDKKEVQEKCREALEPLFDLNSNPMKSLEKVAVILQAETKKTIQQGGYKPLSDKYKRWKDKTFGSGLNILYATGTLFKSIIAKVE